MGCQNLMKEMKDEKNCFEVPETKEYRFKCGCVIRGDPPIVQEIEFCKKHSDEVMDKSIGKISTKISKLFLRTYDVSVVALPVVEKSRD